MENGKRFVFFLILKLVSSKDPKVELPLCPTNIQYLPQTLPMHCRMPRSANFAAYGDGTANQAPTMPPFIPPYYQSPPPEKAPPFPFPVAPPFPMMQMPGGMPPPAPVPIPAPMPMPMPMNPNGPAQKLPVIVMPFYSPDPSYSNNKHPPNHQPSKTTRRPRYYSDDTDADSTDLSSDIDPDSSEGDSDHGWWKSKRGFRRSGRRSHKHRTRRVRKKHRSDIVTPVLQYVNRNGYVIFEKKISKGEAKEWLKADPAKQELKKEEPEEYEEEVIDMNIVPDEKPKEKPRLEEKPHQPHQAHHVSAPAHHANPPTQPQQVKKHRQQKPSKEISKQTH